MRRRRPFAVLVILAALALCVLEVVQTARWLGQAAPWPALGLLLTWALPGLAAAALLGPLLFAPALLTGRRPSGWAMALLMGPSVVVLLACAAHAVFGGFIASGRVLLGLGEPDYAARTAGLLLPFALALYGASTGQLWTRVERGQVVLPGLGPDLSGLRVVQLSDLHAGGVVGERRLRRIAAQVAALKPDLVVVTGDIVNASPHEAALVGPILGALPAPLGVWACMGNHDHFVDGDAVEAELVRHGVRVLRNKGELLKRGGAALWLAGVDDTWTRRTDVAAALAGRPAGVPTLLMAHDPNVWPEAVAQRVELTLSGHTHGGQVGLVKLHPSISLARLITPYVAGRFQQDGSTLYVSRGTANTLPLRLGVPTEVGLFELRDAA